MRKNAGFVLQVKGISKKMFVKSWAHVILIGV